MRKLARPAIAFGSLAIALAALELVCRWTTPIARSVDAVDKGLREYDSVLGYRAQPDARVHAFKRLGDELVFEVDYTIDERGRRATPHDATLTRTKFVLFFGDSFTFGHGVADDQTLPSQVAALARAYRPYNYGLPGWAPQHALALLETRDLRNEIDEPSGLAVYTFIDAQVRRAIGSMNEVRWQSRNAPCYELRDDGVLERTGTFASARPITTKLYSWLAASATLRRVDFELPRLTDEHFELVCALLVRSAELARTKLGAESFVVLFFPGSTLGARFAPCLAARGVRVLDYSAWDDPRATTRILGDGHPAASAYAAVAERLVDDLALR